MEVTIIWLVARSLLGRASAQPDYESRDNAVARMAGLH